MVGVPGASLSNLNPPSLAAVCFGLAQCGLGLLLCGLLRRLTGQPTGPVPSLSGRASDAARERATAGQFCWAVVAVLNLSAMTVFLWHQTSMIATTVFWLGFGQRRPGLHTAPEDPFWVAFRLAWIPVFACVLALFWLAFKDVEKSARRHPKAFRTPPENSSDVTR
ncbi:hypothetical protein [Streptomyces sp. sk226]|uniref:hypothetical protein n=1 Tax=Streptomyces sp. sk226 TaxID=2034268 RepID=UPI00211D848D|nr:hypothetical protein [Streptomyces sp. sk226]